MSEAIETLSPSFTRGFVAIEQLAWGKRWRLGALAPGGWTPLTDVLAETPNDRDHWIVLAQADALVPPRLLRTLEAHALGRLDVDIFYTDDVALAERRPDRRVRLKPAFDITQLVAQDYVGAPLIVRGSAFHRLGGLRATAGEASLYDLLLRAQTMGLGVERIPLPLLAWRGDRPAVPLPARERAVEAWIGGRPLEVTKGLTPGTLGLKRRFASFPPVTLVVPTRQAGPSGGPPHIAELLSSLSTTDWPLDQLHVVVGDDSDDAEALLAPGRWPFRLTRAHTPRPDGAPFNYAAKMNRLWRMAETEHLVLMNDDVQVTSPGWLQALMTFAMDRDVGGVGARLTFPDGRLQHAGVVGGLFGTAVHAWFGSDGAEPGYQDWTLVQREWSMVTGAVFATRRSVLEEVNGFDERFTLEFNDLDLCLRMRLLGHRIVYTPFAQLTHHEKASRGERPPAAQEVAAFLGRWRGLLAEDPAYHPRLTRDRMAPAPLDDAEVP